MDDWIQQWLVSIPVEWFDAHCMAILFISGFLAATVLPMGSEPILVAALLSRANPVAAVAFATVGNSLGAVTTWALGRLGARWWPISESNRLRAEKWYLRWGQPSLLLAWMPVVGDALCLVGGICRVALPRFFILVATGKLVRYAVLAWATLALLP